MNILLENVVYEDSEENCYNYEALYVKGRNIRYIQIPKHVRSLKIFGSLLK